MEKIEKRNKVVEEVIKTLPLSWESAAYYDKLGEETKLLAEFKLDVVKGKKEKAKKKLEEFVESMDENISWKKDKKRLEQLSENLDNSFKEFKEFIGLLDENTVPSKENKEKLEQLLKKSSENFKELERFVNCLNQPMPLGWKSKKENFEEVLKNFDDYFEILKEALTPSYEEYLNEKKKEEEKRIMESRKEKETKIEVKEEKNSKRSIIERIKSLIKLK